MTSFLAIASRNFAARFCDTLKFTQMGSIAATYVRFALSDCALTNAPWRCSARLARPFTGDRIVV